MILFIILALTTTAVADDPTKATISAQLVDEDGNKLELIYRHQAGDLLCNEIDDWRSLDKHPPLNSMVSPRGQTWCVANVHVMVGSDLATKSPQFNYTREFLDVFYLGEHHISTIKEFVDGKVTFSVYPGVGTVVLRTDPIGGHVYYGQIDSTVLKPGVMSEVVKVEMSRLPKVQVITPLKANDQRDRLVDFDESRTVFTTMMGGYRWYIPSSAERREARRTGEPAYHSSYSFAGTWVVMPGEYDVNGSVIPADSVAMISLNGDVLPFEASKPLSLAMNDSVVISIGPAVE